MSVRDHQLRIKFHLIAKSEADRTGSKRVIKRKASRFDLTDADAAVRAGKALTEGHLLTADHIQQKKSFRKCQYILNRICQSPLDPRLHYQSVYYDLYVMLDILIQLDLFRKLVHVSINHDTYITTFFRPFKYPGMFSLFASDYRCKKLDLCPFRKLHHLIYHLIDTLLTDLLAAFGAMWNAYPCIQQSEIIINLCNSSHCRSGISVCGLLINGNCRRQSLDFLHIRLFHLTQELPRIGRQ